MRLQAQVARVDFPMISWSNSIFGHEFDQLLGFKGSLPQDFRLGSAAVNHGAATPLDEITRGDNHGYRIGLNHVKLTPFKDLGHPNLLRAR